MNLPPHISLSLAHNEHALYYVNVAAWLGEVEGYKPPSFQDAAARQRAIDTNSIWTLQWYPDTPASFLHIAAPTLDELLAYAADLQAPLPL